MRLALIVLLLLVATPSHAEPLEGAFGMKLGDVFKGPFKATSSLNDGTPLYEFTPAKPYRAFTRYYVTVTPTTKRISRIWAIGDQESDPKCDAERNVIKAVLEKKYGGKFEDVLFSNDEALKAGTKSVFLKCEGFSPPISIQAIYRDSSMMALEEKERVEQEATKVDTDGL